MYLSNHIYKRSHYIEELFKSADIFSIISLGMTLSEVLFGISGSLLESNVECI